MKLFEMLLIELNTKWGWEFLIALISIIDANLKTGLRICQY
jgi:hypothetical protein